MDCLIKREKFSVSLRKNKRNYIIQSKRLKYSDSEYQGLTLNNFEIAF